MNNNNNNNNRTPWFEYRPRYYMYRICGMSRIGAALLAFTLGTHPIIWYGGWAIVGVVISRWII